MTTTKTKNTPDIRRATHGFNVYIHPALVQVHVNDEDEAEGERLANLIAAAPELLDIAKALNVMGEHIEISQGLRLDQIFAANFKALRSVIAKAEGQP